MPVHNLTHNYVAGLEAKPPSERVEIWDQRQPGLCLRIGPSGVGTWSFRYRPKTGAGYQRVTLGRLGDLTLADARERAARHRVEVADGGDPQRERKARRTSAAAVMSFDTLAQRYLDEYAKPNKASWKNDEIYLKRVRRVWGRRAASSITRRDGIELLDQIKRAAPVSANRTHTVLVTLFNWAVEDQHLETNPIAGLKKRAREKPKERVLSDAEIRLLWASLLKSNVASEDVTDALRFLLLTGQRPIEVAGISQIELRDLDKPEGALWEVPAERMKARRPHCVPLTDRAVAILNGALARRAVDGDELSVFASRFVARGTLARHSLSQALGRIIDSLEVEGADRETIVRLQDEPPTPRDFRRTVATGMSRLGVTREDRKAVLAHVEGDVHGQHYDKYERLKEKREALSLWAAHVSALTDAHHG